MRVKDSPSFKWNVWGRVTPLLGTELRPVSFTKRQQNEEAFFQKHSWPAHVFPGEDPLFPSLVSDRRNIVSRVSYVFKIQIMLTLYTAGNFNEISSMRARPSEHSSNFCEQFEQRPNFASTFKLDHSIPLGMKERDMTIMTSGFYSSPLLLAISANLVKVFTV